MKTDSLQLSVAINKEYDKASILEFIDDMDGDYDFGDYCILQLHPELKGVRGQERENQIAAISAYTDRYYSEHSNDIEEAACVMRSSWDGMKKAYLEEVRSIFGSLDFLPNRLVVASPSITDCNDIKDDHTGFHVWYGYRDMPEYIRRTFAHEILHFYYYAYVKQEGFKNLVNNWDLAEIFNVVVLGLPKFIEITGKADEGYPQHQKYFSYYRNLWENSSNLEKYLEKTDKEGLVSL
jgi:hypothetical protein